MADNKARLFIKGSKAINEGRVAPKQRTHFSHPSASPINQVLFLQKTLGNQAVQRLFTTGTIQPKLRIGHPNDIYEQEADRVADEVMRMPEPTIQPKLTLPFANDSSCQNEEFIQAKLNISLPNDKYEQEADWVADQVMSMPAAPVVQQQAKESKATMTKPLLQRQANGDLQVALDLENRLAARRGHGQPLTPGTRAFMEPRFGADFGGVRVHTDGEAAQMSADLNAQAFTQGRDIYFGAGKYDSGSTDGQRLLAHELTHVVQQENASQTTKRISRPGDDSEVATHRSAHAIVAGRPVMGLDIKGNSSESSVHSVPEIQRWDDPEQRTIVNSPPLPVEERELPLPFGPVAPRIVGEFDFGEDVHVVDPLMPELLNPAGNGWHTYTAFPDTPQWNALLGELVRIVTETRQEAAAATDTSARYYRRRSGLMYVSERQAEWERTQSLDDIGIETPTYRQGYLWAAFKYLLTAEGDSSSINTYDDQIVTWGHGFSARAGEVGRILNAVPQAMRRWLHRGGIHIFPNNSFGLLLLPNAWRPNPVVVREDLALSRMRRDQGALNMLVALAQADVEVGGRQERQWVLREQFLRFVERNGDLTEARLRARPREVVFAAILMKHWLGGTRQIPLLSASNVDEVINRMIQQHPGRAADINSRRSHHRSRIRQAVADARTELDAL